MRRGLLTCSQVEACAVCPRCLLHWGLERMREGSRIWCLLIPVVEIRQEWRSRDLTADTPSRYTNTARAARVLFKTSVMRCRTSSRGAKCESTYFRPSSSCCISCVRPLLSCSLAVLGSGQRLGTLDQTQLGTLRTAMHGWPHPQSGDMVQSLCGPCSAISLLCCVTDIAEERILEPWNRVSRSASRSLGRAWNGAPLGRVSGVLCGVEAVGPCGRDVVSHSSWPLHPEVVTSLPHRRPSPVATSKYT
ncbi:hypothetical protein OH76DRAFT_1097069 [Lentinus brumalis]|uniref:Uncharacterized protein n=1 Tax=Lentinus brumalis TaxID=2498619 RepID=A0A371CVU0_9APHY|nr:hypothetical protein OH76DRAFT_1097069 [Polyporus brumalis]